MFPNGSSKIIGVAAASESIKVPPPGLLITALTFLRISNEE